jgi:hypothetical protein
MTKYDEYQWRVEAIVGGVNDGTFEEALERFFQHLKTTFQLPCEVTGTEDFQWEEPYVIGGWSQKEYERLKKNQPSYTDRYDLLAIEQNEYSEWMLFSEDIAAIVRRKRDGKEFVLGLAELRATDKKSNNFQLLDDYAKWLVNNR